MARSFIAGDTSYENQSVEDIKNDIIDWIKDSENVITEYSSLYNDVIKSEFSKRIPYNYMSFLKSFDSIVRANIEDFKIVLQAITNGQINESRVNLFNKIGEKSVKNFNIHENYYKSDNDNWREYGNASFKKVEDLYALIGDYFSDLWDVSNAAYRLRDYIVPVRNESTITYSDNSIKIGDKNKISNSVLGNSINSTKKTESSNEGWLSSVSSQVVATIIGGILLAIILLYLGLSN